MDPHINPATGVWDDNYFAQQQQAQKGGGTLYGGIPVSSIQGPTVQPFGWSTDQWNKAQQDALAKLTPYYKQLLDLNNGDTNRAKAALQADYASGVRYNTGENAGQMSQENITEADEMKSTLDDLNSRGILFQEQGPGQGQNTPQAQGTDNPTPTVGAQSGTGVTSPMDTSGVVGSKATMTNPGSGLAYSGAARTNYFDPLLNKQQQRRNAIQRAIQRQSDTANINYTKGLGDVNSQQTQKALSLGEQENQQAMTMAQNQYQHAYDVSQGAQTGAVQPYLDTSSNASNTAGAGASSG